MNRQAHGDAPVSIQIAIIAGALLAVAVIKLLPDFIPAAHGSAQTEIEACRAEIANTRARAEQWADAAIRAFALAERAADSLERAQRSAAALAKQVQRRDGKR